MKTPKILFVISLLTATAAFAHGGVKNPAVMARMDAMAKIAENAKVLGQMAKGQKPFDARAARTAAAAIATHSGQVPDLFRTEETDPKSEALPEIWQEFDRFTQISDDLTEAAAAAEQTIRTKRDLRPALKAIGRTCKSCHRDYRLE